MAEFNSDKDNMKGVLEQFPQHCEKARSIGKSIKFNEAIESIAVCGMGGSAISGDLLRNVAGDPKIPILTFRDYNLPKYIKSKSLVFVASYSGNTEETLSALQDAYQRGCKIVAISSGGRLEQECEDKGITHINIPPGMQPRLATPYLFFPMLNILRNLRIIDIDDSEIDESINYLKKAKIAETAEELAEKIYKRTPLIYASTRYSAVAMKWKTDIDENTKVHAFYNIYPEFNHNELNAYESDNPDYYAIIIRDEMENIRIAKRMGVTGKLMKQHKVNFTEITLKGDSMIRKVLSATYMGLWVSFFLAMKYDTNPTPVKIIEDLKKMLR